MVHNRGEKMPKTTKDVKQRIFEVAAELFCKKDYDDVEMRDIAKRCGLAVGTLYNYYPNKKELYLSIFDDSWQKTFRKLKEVDKTTESTEKKIKKYIHIIYQDIKCRRGFGRALSKTNPTEIIEDNRICHLKEKILNEIISLIEQLEKKEIFAKDSQIDHKIAETLLVTTVLLIEAHSEDTQKNIEYLYQLVRAFTL